MSKVSTEQVLHVPADKVWSLIGNFNALPQWHPAVESSELSEGGNIRTLSLVGGGQIIEKLEKIQEGVFEYSYSIVDSPLPVANYTSTLRIKQGDDDNSCVVEWGGRFNPATGSTASEAENAVMGIYQAGFDNLKKIFGMP